MYTSARVCLQSAHRSIPAARIRGLLAASDQHSDPSTTAASRRSVLPSVSPRRGLQAGLFCLNIPVAAQAKVLEPRPSGPPGRMVVFLQLRWISVVLEACRARVDSLFVGWRTPDFLRDTGSLFCTVSEEHMNPGSCVFIMHSRLVRTYYPMGIYENGQYQSVQ